MRPHVTRVASALALAALAALAGRPVEAQSYFGKNQVQYDHFEWRILETDHFLIHYYPIEHLAAEDAGRMAERAYAQLSRVLQHEFREKKPIVIYSSRADFGQNLVLGDLGEGVQGVTEAQRHRILLYFTGDYGSFQHVLTHEMVHEFQYDIFARGKAGAGLQVLAQINPPGWFAEGMAEYLSIGPTDPFTATWIRDAALNTSLPSIEQMTQRPDRYFPYRFGEALWAYIGQRWGDEVIGNIMNAVPNVGLERAFKRELGKSLEELSDEWREAMQVQHLPQIAQLERARKIAKPLLTERRSGGEVFVAPVLSDDGNYIAFLSNGNFLRGEVFIDLWLGDARTGKRIKRLVKSTLDPNVEELQLIYSQSSFSPNGKQLAFTAQREGKDVLYILDLASRRIVRRIDAPLETVTGPTWSPDGTQLVFSGGLGGISDLYMVNSDGTGFRQLTKDRYGDLQPQWSPDGKTVAFTSDRGPITNFDLLKYNRLRIALYHIEDGRIEVLPGQAGLNVNPQWAPDGRSIAYVSDRSGIQNVFLYDLGTQQHYQLTNVVGGVSSFTEASPAISWARKADRLAFNNFENGQYTVWTIDNPRLLKKSPYHDPTPSVVAKKAAIVDSASIARTELPRSDSSANGATSLYRSPAGIRASDQTPGSAERTTAKGAVSVAALLDSAAYALPDTAKFKDYAYKTRFSPDYIARPSVGYTNNTLGSGVYGGTAIVLSDLLGNQHLAFAGEINGSVSEGLYLAQYTNLSHRFQYSAGLYQQPFYFAQFATLNTTPQGFQQETEVLTRYIQRQAFGVGIYPLNRFSRFELGTRLTSLSRSDLFVSQFFDPATGGTSGLVLDSTINNRTVNYLEPYLGYVSDNTLFGYTGPISGRRFRFQVTPTVGNFRWVEYLADYRRYDPIIFNYLTVATRGLASLNIGPDADSLRKYIGYPDIIRGYDRETFRTSGCATGSTALYYKCSPLLGSRIAVGNAELRFPLLRGQAFGLPIALPPIEGLVFYDAGLAWFGGQSINGTRSNSYDASAQRYLLTSHGYGVRVNLFGFAILRWDYSYPHDALNRKPYWQFSLGPSY
ncbi:MAG: hypothetical protein M3068_01210 [Gemmatimonadota bacterium]|nr:hypothetical protein [Gemmatimonadota bacterium]